MFALLVSQLYELSKFFENVSFSRVTKVLKSEFKVEAIIIFLKSIKKRHRVVYSLYTKACYMVCYKFTGCPCCQLKIEGVFKWCYKFFFCLWCFRMSMLCDSPAVYFKVRWEVYRCHCMFFLFCG